MYFIFFISAIIIFCIFLGLISLILKYLNKKFDGKLKKNLVTQNLKKTSYIIGILITFLTLYCFLFKSYSYNEKKAYVEKQGAKTVITIFGRRELMVHDPISFFKNETYKDSIRLIVPQLEGTIKAGEVININPNFKYIKGAIIVNNNNLTINLFYISAYYKNVEASTWNGTYEIERK